MTTYERITYKPEGGKARTMILENPTEVVVAGGRCLTGIEVDNEATEVAPRGVDARRHIISLELISKRTPLRMNNIYGTLEKA